MFFKIDFRGAKNESLLKRVVLFLGGCVLDVFVAFVDVVVVVFELTKLAVLFLANWFSGEISFIIILFVVVLGFTGGACQNF